MRNPNSGPTSLRTKGRELYVGARKSGVHMFLFFTHTLLYFGPIFFMHELAMLFSQLRTSQVHLES